MVERIERVAVLVRGKSSGWALVARTPTDRVELVAGSLPRSARADHDHLNAGRWVRVASTMANKPVPNGVVAILRDLDIDVNRLLA